MISLYSKYLAQGPLLRSLQLFEGEGQLELRGTNMERSLRDSAEGNAQITEQGVMYYLPGGKCKGKSLEGRTHTKMVTGAILWAVGRVEWDFHILSYILLCLFSFFKHGECIHKIPVLKRSC